MNPRVHSNERQQGVLLLNLGTPRRPESKEVKDYLEEFLMDPQVVDIPYFFRWLLVHGLILRTRPTKSAKAYQKIWTDRGSPLLFHLLDLSKKVQDLLGKEFTVKSAMRYGEPSISRALKEFKDAQIPSICIAPLYPQYSLAATQSSIDECLKKARELYPQAALSFVPPFYEHTPFIDAFSEIIARSLIDFEYDHLLFSFHGLPERQLKKLHCLTETCLKHQDCCSQVTYTNSLCYKAQCFKTASLLAEKLNLPQDRFSVAFQSRLGRTPWIRPFSDHVYQELPQKGIKRLAVACPSFVADCLETLEEVQIRGKDLFCQSGGEDLKLVPSLNAEDLWAQALTSLVYRQTPPQPQQAPVQA